MKRQIRISDTHFKELDRLSEDMGLKKSETLGISLSILGSLRNHGAKLLKIITDDGNEIEILLPLDVVRNEKNQ